MSQMPELEVAQLEVRYGPITAIQDISFRVQKNEILCVLGGNGAGKTTLLKTISGLLRPSRGEIRFRGESLIKTPAHQIVSKGLSHVPEGRGIFLNLTVEENLDLGAWTKRDHKVYQEDLERGFTLFPRLKERRSQVAGTLSGGEQQMLAMARALMARPEFLLLDEPSLGLAPQMIETIFRVIADIHRAGVTVLLVEQNAALALEISHRGVVIETGRVRQQGPASELLKSDEIQKAYLGG